MSLDNGQSGSRLRYLGAILDLVLRKLELVTKIVWKRELGSSGLVMG